jgi:non-ribosomal peptide synthetase component F
LFMLLLTAFDVLLYRLTQQTDIVVGTDVANRTQIETEGLIGFFVNLLALRTDLQGAPSFRTVMQQVKNVTLEAYVHQELPFDVVVEHLQIERKERQIPLVRALFVLQNASARAAGPSNIAFEPVQDSGPAKFDLAFFLQEGWQGIGGRVMYRTEIFKEETIAMLVRRLETLLRSVMIAPDTSIDELEIYTDEEKEEERQKEEKMQETSRKILRLGKGEALDLANFQSLLGDQET